MNNKDDDQSKKSGRREDLLGYGASFPHPNSPLLREMIPPQIPIAIEVKKLHPDARIPHRQHLDDVGFDLYSIKDYKLFPNNPTIIQCGVSIAPPPLIHSFITGRSGMAKEGVFCHVGTIDSGYRGELGPILVNLTPKTYLIRKHWRVAQLVFLATNTVHLKTVEAFSRPSERGVGGFGSTGRE